MLNYENFPGDEYKKVTGTTRLVLESRKSRSEANEEGFSYVPYGGGFLAIKLADKHEKAQQRQARRVRASIPFPAA